MAAELTASLVRQSFQPPCFGDSLEIFGGTTSTDLTNGVARFVRRSRLPELLGKCKSQGRPVFSIRAAARSRRRVRQLLIVYGLARLSLVNAGARWGENKARGLRAPYIPMAFSRTARSPAQSAVSAGLALAERTQGNRLEVTASRDRGYELRGRMSAYGPVVVPKMVANPLSGAVWSLSHEDTREQG